MIANPLAAVTVLTLSWAAPAPTSVKDPAELLPANTVAYAELRQPGKLVKEFASLFEGSVLANVPDSLARLLPPGQKPPRRGFGELGGFGLLLSPELIKEAQRLQGAAIALTGFKDGQPEWLAVVLPGESNAPAFLMRAVLATAPVIPAGEVEGVRLYRVILGGSRRIKRKTGLATRPPGEKPAQPKREFLAPPVILEETSYGPVVALTPNALFIGSADAVKDAIRRARGNGKGASLAANKTFREARKDIGSHPGLFAYAEPAPLVKVLDGLAVLAGFAGFPGFAADFAAVRDFINPKGFRCVAYGLTLEKATLRLSKLVILNPDEKSPLLELMPSKPVSTALFQFTPSKPVLAAALSNDNGQERWGRIVKLLDAVAKLSGNRGKTPSEAIAEVEKALGVDIGKDVFGKITAAGFALGNPLDTPKRRAPGQPVIPFVLILQADSAEAAKGLIALAPKVFALGTGKQMEPATRDIGGHKVSVLGGEGDLCYGSEGRTIVFGPFSKSVGQALANGAKEKGWLSNPKLAARLEKGEAPIMLAVARPFSLVIGLTMLEAQQRAQFKATRTAPPGGREFAPGAGQARFKQQMAKLLEKEGLLIVRVTRKPDRMLAETTLTDLKPMVGRLVDFALTYFLSRRASAENAPRPSEAIPTPRPK